MLKALELSGFKSFADRTRFEFPPGITVIVGPNGSGKSNIVDALKWVLGEQSAKSLRGKEMSDVIFKGSSGPGSRKPAASASVTLVLDNSGGNLLCDAPEVHVTRRVFRSGESEYLLNGEPCRLKDIRNLFRGTGIGTDAYSLIEQGKVERLLQASPRDRRAIFEEAAGISRFKARKVEAERRLERVQANLTRLADIVEEVGSRYRTVKNQASRAARYRELTARLQELRTFVGLKDYRTLGERMEAVAASVQQLAREQSERESQATAGQQQVAALEQQLDAINARLGETQEAIATTRAEIAQVESRIDLERQRRADWSTRIANARDEAALLSATLAALREQLGLAREEEASARAAFDSATGTAAALDGQIQHLLEQLEKLRTREEQERAQLDGLEAGWTAASHGVTQLTARVEALRMDEDRARSAAAESTATVGRFQAELDELASRRRALEEQAGNSDSALALARQGIESLEETIAQRQKSLADLQSTLAGVTQRAKVISDLERKLSAAASGTRFVLDLGKSDPELGVVGLVADLIQVQVRHAELVDVALGPLAQHVVTENDGLLRRIALGEVRVPGRIGILPLDHAAPLPAPVADPGKLPGVVGPAYSLIESADRRFQPCLERLLAGTWLVENLTVALALREQGFRNARFVTLDGELVEPGGTVLAGARGPSQGIVSRRSELRELARQQEELGTAAAEAGQSLEALRRDLAASKKESQRILGENQQISGALSACQAAIAEAERNLQRSSAEARGRETECQKVAALLGELAASLALETTRAAQLDAERSALTASLAAIRAETRRLDAERAAIEAQRTQAKVAVARTEQQCGEIQRRITQLVQGEQEQSAALERVQAALAADEASFASSSESSRADEQQLAKLAESRESLADLVQTLSRDRSEADQLRKSQAASVTRLRNEIREINDTLAEQRLRVSQWQMERDQLAARLLEDYGLDVAAIAAAETPAGAEDREKIDAEISELRQKIGVLGSVNMEALAELESLEQRYQSLDGQYQDLVTARDSLLRIIHRINNDSRKLFAGTLEAIRLNFQRLFRQTFGGGQADIVLEENVDILEAGVEIIATPPGKPKFNNSLLSGGEKALTAVSLLMAIFQYRPSPFCVLDEVDAPFDEANIGRFIDVLKSFLSWTRFVIVTHSKKTMTAATTLYGVTMQESGVSKRVSVRFEDVSDDGQIADDALRRGDGGSDSDGQRTVA